MKRMADPTAGIEPLRMNALDQVNAGYSGLPNKIGTQLAKRGMGQSGQMGAALKGVDISRMRDLSTTGATYDKLGLDQQNSTMQMIQQMLNSGRGTSSTSPSNMLGGAINGGISTLTTLQTIDKMLKAGGAAASAPAGGYGVTSVANLPGVMPGAGSAAAGGGAAGGGAATGGTAAALGGLGANLGIGAAGVGLAYIFAKPPWAWGKGTFESNLAKQFQSGEIKLGDPVSGDYALPGLSEGKYWIPRPESEGGQAGVMPVYQGTAQEYFNATGQWPPAIAG